MVSKAIARNTRIAVRKARMVVDMIRGRQAGEALQLLEFTHERYPGTDTPKNFQSRIRLTDPERGEDREVKIYMN